MDGIGLLLLGGKLRSAIEGKSDHAMVERRGSEE